MDDMIRRPRPRPQQPQQAQSPRPVRPQPFSQQPLGRPGAAPAPTSVAPPVHELDLSLSSPAPVSGGPARRKKQSIVKKPLFWVLMVATLIVLFVAGAFAWYQSQLAPVDKNDQTKTLFIIEPGATPSTIATSLEDEKLIKSEEAFLLYTRISGTQGQLQAGSYRLSRSESVAEIVDHLVKGRVDTFEITFLPGETLENNKKVLLDAGFTKGQVESALTKTYDSPLFKGKPADADLEGYLYGNTYQFGAGVTAEEVLEHVFDFYYKEIQDNAIEAGLKKQGLNLYEGITLASIIQRESSPKGDDAPQIAQVFYSRLNMDMPLGSDVTYQYIADKTGVQRDPNLESPYNTRNRQGLPPGPISVPGVKALKAAANPASGDYLYFLSGDDDITYFARTLEGHEANISKHCAVKCQII